MFERDHDAKLLVIGGPFDGQRMARIGDEFTESIGNGKSALKGRFTYFLRWHPVLKQHVWALPTNKSVSLPKLEKIDTTTPTGPHVSEPNH